MIMPALTLLLQLTARAKVPRESAHVTSTDVTLLLSNLKLSFFTSMAQIHRLNLINLNWVPYRAALKLNLSFNATSTDFLKVEGWIHKTSVLATSVRRTSIKMITWTAFGRAFSCISAKQVVKSWT